MRVLTWNLYHGRAKPPAGRPLEHEFCSTLRRWPWDVALLQEVPPWWGPMLGRACGAHARTALTSRNELLPARRFVADRWPDLIKSNGGGANTILVRSDAVTAHKRVVLRTSPERRVCHAVRLASGVWAANLHAQVRPHSAAYADIASAAGWVREWAGSEPCVFGGDFNVKDPAPEGFTSLGGNNVDFVFARGLAVDPAAEVELPRRGRLSDHRPVLVTVG